MTDPFGSVFANDYDILYRDKDYAHECALLEELYTACSNRPLQSVLDLGCGTGGHALVLAAKGYDVVGVDRSSEMLDRAQAKATTMDLNLEFHLADIASARFDRSFDLTILMFAVMGYQTTNEQVRAALRTARRHLANGGILMFDVWFGPAVLTDRPGPRVRVVEEGERTVIRTSDASVSIREQLCEVTMQLWELSSAGLVDHAIEVHAMRYFFPREIELLLDAEGFRLERLAGWPNVETPADDTTWNVVAVASVKD